MPLALSRREEGKGCLRLCCPAWRLPAPQALGTVLSFPLSGPCRVSPCSPFSQPVPRRHPKVNVETHTHAAYLNSWKIDFCLFIISLVNLKSTQVTVSFGELGANQEAGKNRDTERRSETSSPPAPQVGKSDARCQVFDGRNLSPFLLARRLTVSFSVLVAAIQHRMFFHVAGFMFQKTIKNKYKYACTYVSTHMYLSLVLPALRTFTQEHDEFRKPVWHIAKTLNFRFQYILV